LQKGDYGRADVKFKKDLDDLGQKIPLDFGNDLKAATTDCFKRCAMWLGVAADVYDPEEFMQIEIVGSEENSDSNKNRERMIKEAKKSIKTPGKEVKNER
jgi:hypothetical protein